MTVICPVYGMPGRVLRDLYVLGMRRYRDAAANSSNRAPLVRTAVQKFATEVA